MPLTRTLQEVVFAVHFAGPIPFTIGDVANWIGRHGGEEAAVQQLDHLARVELPLPGQAMAPSFQLIPHDASGLPRIRLRAPDGVTLYILQDDRVAFGWQRDAEVGVDVEYPGYDVLRERWSKEVEKFDAWMRATVPATLAPRLVELSYNNAFPLEVAGERRRMSEIFKFIDVDYRPVNAFHVSWSEFLAPALGEGAVTAQAGLTTAPPGQRVLAVNYFGLGAVDEVSEEVGLAEVVMRGLDKLHDRILDMHQSAIKSV